MTNAASSNAAADAAIATAIEHWFEAAKRDLPWRRERSGYAALVSELMLQQTQVSRVIDAFTRFMARFPTVSALAAADEQDVLAMWQGLGYYRRARLLHAAAHAVVNDHEGRVPRDAATLLALPGIGRYTAGAIASIVHGERAPIVDGNVKRVLSRVDANGQPDDRWYWSRAEALVNASGDPGRFNEGLMELGATVCTPRQPACMTCPIRSHCAAADQSRQGEFPPAKTPTKRVVLHHHSIVIARRDTVLLEQRPARGLWSRMWQPLGIETPTHLDDASILDHLTCSVTSLDALETFRHLTSHREVWFHVYTARTRARSGAWIALNRIDEHPMSNAHRRVLSAAGVHAATNDQVTH